MGLRTEAERPKTAYVCWQCRNIFVGKPFDGWTGGGLIFTDNRRDLCLRCAGAIAMAEGQEMMALAARKEKPIPLIGEHA